jgi:DNA-binding transcriptional MerR regulator
LIPHFFYGRFLKKEIQFKTEMRGRQMGISVLGLEKKMSELGYRIKAPTIKHYINIGLLETPHKIGGAKKGVRFVFEDVAGTIERLKRIADLKGRGFRMDEIPKELWKAEQQIVCDKARERLSRFVESKGDFFEEIEWPPGSENYQANGFKFAHYTYADSAADLLDEKLWRAEELHKYDTLPHIRADFLKVEEKGLWRTPYFYNGRLVYECQYLYQVARFVDLHRGYDLPWSTIEDLSGKHRQNMERFEQWPEVDGIRFNRAWVGVQKKEGRNAFASNLVDVFQWIKDGCPIYPQEPTSVPYWHSQYQTVDKLVEDFLKGRCAFLPSPIQEPHSFLKRFEAMEGDNGK